MDTVDTPAARYYIERAVESAEGSYSPSKSYEGLVYAAVAIAEAIIYFAEVHERMQEKG